MSENFLAIGNEELGESVKKGDLVQCGVCDKQHPLECGINNRTKQEDSMLMFYKCGKNAYLAAVAGQLISK